jgi:uncharacterized radical SAM superfamily Fe-S cluster-containing enzyme
MEEIDQTQGLCSRCLQVLPAKIFKTGSRIVLEKVCPVHGKEQTLISSDALWYERIMRYPAVLSSPASAQSPSAKGCPLDCGYCPAHDQRVYLPVVPITSACNLDCPVCYTINKNRNSYFMSRDEFATILGQIRANDPEMQIINFTGGEPLIHPHFCELVEMCREDGIHRITISTNGMRFLEDPELLPRLTDLDTRIVLSFNSFNPGPYQVTAGRDLLEKKIRILSLLEKYKPSTTLLTVVAAGVNDHEIGDIVRFVLESDFIVSSEIHTVTFTGQSMGRFDASTRLTVPDVLDRIIEKNPFVSKQAFLPSPCAHPMCYSTCYFLKLENGRVVPFTDFLAEKDMLRALTGHLYMEPTLNTEEVLKEAVNVLWSSSEQTEKGEQILMTLRALLNDMFGSRGMDFSARQQRAEKTLKAVYVHSHMDAANFDIARVRQCCVAVPDGQGGHIPTCSYNTIYRAKDPRFCEEV